MNKIYDKEIEHFDFRVRTELGEDQPNGADEESRRSCERDA